MIITEINKLQEPCDVVSIKEGEEILVDYRDHFLKW